MTRRWLVLPLLWLGLFGGCVDPSRVAPEPACRIEPGAMGEVVARAGVADEQGAPEIASGYRRGMRAARARSFMVVTANPLASRTGCEVLSHGGTAADAAVAVQMVLGLVEPQSSGLGGGAFALYFDAARGTVQAYDGRETAPIASTADDLRWISDQQRRAPQPDARGSGRSIGTPGVVRMLELLHGDHGRLAWKPLLQPSIDLAREGFSVSPRLAASIAGSRAQLQRDAQASAYFLDPVGRGRPTGFRLTNPAYADTLQRLAEDGPGALYAGPIARDIVEKAQASRGDGPQAIPLTPGRLQLSDLAGYRAVRREPVCTTYRAYWICGAPPPSSGGMTVAAVLGVLEALPIQRLPPSHVDAEGGRPALEAVHLIAEAERLAYADRDRYIADTDFVALPGGSPSRLLDKAYLASRAALLRADRSMGTATAGRFEDAPGGMDATPEHGTSHISIVDREGNALAMTSSVESAFGSFHMTHGFVLNNQLTDFSAAPADAHGAALANRIEPGKRPRSIMAPTLVFDRASDGGRGALRMVTGSPGGSAIAQYVVKTLVGVLDWQLDAQQASALMNFGATNTPRTTLGGEHPLLEGDADPLVDGLRRLGHQVSTAAYASGVATIVRARRDGEDEWQGGADPRREGIALGDAPRP
jgi:gamma-glutamyltranspeptidase/glutathione hydrolase